MDSLAVGFFDGVHLGHQAILENATAALTFRNHPLTILDPARAPQLLMSPDARIAAIRAQGVGDVRVLDFTPELAALPPEVFAARYLTGEVRCGANWRFGKGGVGDAVWLQARGFRVAVVPSVEYDGKSVSSTRIRAALMAGKIEDANAMMGRSFRIEGMVFAGKGEGRKLGYPTINLKSQVSDIRLPYGVYEVEIAGQKAIANYGLAPTFGEKAWQEPMWELHLLQPSTSSLHLISPSPSTSFSLLRFLRAERKFDSVEDLKRQIAKDCAIIQL